MEPPLSEKTVSRPDANPALAALLTGLVLGTGHLIVNGQPRKWGYSLLATLAGCCACLIPGIAIAIFSIIDAYQTAERLRAGEVLGENEYTFPLMFKAARIFDKTATGKAQ